tara:strand:+ start:394 stop:501 length:108 start_codon:yes stop_codon:yes gene_type:complete
MGQDDIPISIGIIIASTILGAMFLVGVLLMAVLSA